MQSRDLRDLESVLDEVSRLSAAPDDQLQKIAAGVSAWSASQQLDHMIKVANSMLGVVAAAKPVDGLAGINLLGRTILLIGWIPRGRAKAPQKMHGVASSSKDLLEQLENARVLLTRIAGAEFEPADVPVARHPLFRGLTPRQTLRFVVVHTRHHLKIVKDINAAG